MKPFFEVVSHDGEVAYRANEHAQSAWGDDHVAGPAVVGLLAQVLEDEQHVEGFMPARTTFELLRAFKTVPTIVRTETIRTGSRIKVARADAFQNDTLVATAMHVQYRMSENAPGDRWRPDATVPAPPVDTDPSAVTWYHSDRVGWTSELEKHLNADRSTAWWNVLPMTADRPPSPYVRAVTTAEWTSLVTNLGTEWVGYINGDLTVALSRLPEGDWVGVREDSHIDTEGIAVGTTTLYDVHGPIGSGMVTALNNTRAFS
ncbi:MAG: thioesterase family protein [Corynebacteriales bacterium]|uniref:Thioesterase family protein n=1 Tax=Williamsia herbipolensis TaxID=1603258 RepID=A0AAU4K166_9NOCA|nr:acyl-CoA thioesterase domain-containing protein [Williamsia herbipolensis]MCX6467707.1 thioesterase family protein [Mycobacteriales bacterium]